MIFQTIVKTNYTNYIVIYILKVKAKKYDEFFYFRVTLESKVNIDGSEVSKIVEKEIQNYDTRHQEQLTIHIQR